jgi:glycosyltransferase involved in cell wall biosynthesis
VSIRLLQIIPLYDSYRVFLKELADSLRRDGHEVLTLCSLGPENTIKVRPDEEPFCRDFKIPRGANPLRHLIAARRMRKVIEAYRPTHIHAHFSAAALSTALARPKHSTARWLVTYQGLQFPHTSGWKGKATRFAEAYSASKMDEAWILTSDDAVELKKAAPRANVRKQASPGFGVSERFFTTPKGNHRTTCRKQLGISESDTVYLFIGRLVQFKGFHLAARAIFKAAQVRSDIRWVVIGERDPLHPCGLTDAEWHQFQQHSSIHWLRTQADVLPWLDASDAYLFPTKREGMPVSVMEALARSKPVLTFKVRGCRELIQDGENGRFFPSDSIDAIIKTMENSSSLTFSPSETLRRSNWIREMCDNYGIAK